MPATAAPRTSVPENASTRTLKILEPGSQGKDDFCDNKVITSHYTVWNFLPKNAYEQFSKPANVYFLFLSVLQCTPRITTTSGVPTILLPLVCILTLNAIKDAIEDWRRHKSDRKENELDTTLVRDKTSKEVIDKWQEAHVGDLVVVKNNDYIPADLVLLSSSHEEGQVFIETANLDGETNLKTKAAPDNALKLIGKHEKFEDAAQTVQTFQGSIECDAPNEFLYQFMGTLHMGKADKPVENVDKIPLDESMVLLRGCKVKNVAWAIGVAVYTGKQSKIMMNSKQRTGRKLSHLEYQMGKFTAAIFVLQNILCLLAGIGSAVFETSDYNLARRYLNLQDRNGNADSGFLIFVIRFFNFIILFSNFIPISLLVSVSMVKLIQVFFMYSDVDMIYKKIHCMPRTSDLNEEMGQVEYVFSDKTGTLTCNVMDFRKFCVDGIVYGEGMTEIRRNVMLKMGQKVEDEPKPQVGGKITPHVDLVDNRLDDLLKSKSGPHYAAVRTFLLHLAINHEVVSEAAEGGLPNYSASSPDESALCYGARHFGFVFLGRDSQNVRVMLEDGSTIRVEIKAILKFNSTRKRSSAIVRFEDTDPAGVRTQRLQILTKGADSVIMARLASRLQQATTTQRSHQVVKEFAEDGLRTLCLAGRDLTQEEFDKWLVKFQDASVSTRNRQEMLDAVADEIETNLEIHGITGIEDRLQDDVAGTIVKMTLAGIKVWMLTGDKVETAINIGIATGLLEPVEGDKGERPVFVSSDFENDRGEFQPQAMCRKLSMVADNARTASKTGRLYEGFVVDGKCLEVCLEPGNEKEFVAISKNCRTVICCRVSPKQKGAVVRLMKKEEKAITLAIGDGANDCNMIQSADVGIGIRGLEGLQAFNVSDYGISQFRFLGNLLFVHGRWCYRRVAILVNYTFYKNVVVVLPQYFLGCVSGFSGQKLYNDLMYQSYNVVHSMLPILLFGILDQDVSKKVALRFPELYSAGLKHEYLNRFVSAGWMLSGLWHSFVLFFLPYYVMSNGNTTHADGKANDIWLLGSVVYLLVTIIVNLRACLETFFITGLTFLGIAFSFLWWLLMHGGLSGIFTGSVYTAELHGTTQRIFGCPMIYLVLLSSVVLSLAADMQFKGLMCLFRPSALQKVQEQVLQEKRDERQAKAAGTCTSGVKVAH